MHASVTEYNNEFRTSKGGGGLYTARHTSQMNGIPEDIMMVVDI